MTEECKADGSIQKLVVNQWKTVGIGHLCLLSNTHNPTGFLLKLLRNKRNEIHIFQCKSKAKVNGPSLIMRGTDTKNKQEYILALRFKESHCVHVWYGAIRRIVKAAKQTPNLKLVPNSKHHIRSTTEDVIAKMKQQSWDCSLCCHDNKAGAFMCEMCRTPRPVHMTTPAPNLKLEANGSVSMSFPDPYTPSETHSAAISIDTPSKLAFAANIASIVEEEDEKAAGNDNEENEDDEEQKESIKELINMVTNGSGCHGCKYNEVQNILLLGHDTFTDCKTMLNTIVAVVTDDCLADSNTRIRGIQMLESWIKQYFESDFYPHSQVMDAMYAFIDNLEDADSSDSQYHRLTSNDIKLLLRVKSTFEQRAKAYESQQKKQHIQRRSKKIFGEIDVPKNYDIMAESDESIAQQITLMDFNCFKAIAQRELCGQAWKKKDREERAPNVMAMINQFNRVSRWVQCVVLQQRNRKKRAKCMEKLIRIAMHLKKLRNFSGCCAIKTGLASSNVYRLKMAWSLVSKAERKQHEEITEIFGGENNYKLLRQLHKNAYAPSILYCGVFLQDLLNTDEANTDRAKDGTVNFNKLKKTYRLIQQICLYQQSNYDEVKPDHVMQAFLRKAWDEQACYDDDKLYKISVKVKEKDNENKDIDEEDIVSFAW
eukprot:CAMPEP_0202689252 /NCGR_PEP_ID=MMETSP1385-20130828/4554_1 /ASSEMBLY_ACC=CAM_ASM_000861 /TAXON_ID=933848 /ORGANISM="Elphidium margaritaceum" /LENGTH=654 /DNA_ID=CAMNT_0049344363 /DNA_START=23 /DNA_END=1987 /DNA_ORIENTATION=-